MELLEDVVIPDIFVSGIARIERLSGGLVRIVFFSERHEQGQMIHAVAAKIVRPVATWPDALRLLTVAMGNANQPFVAEGGVVKPLDS